MFLCLSSIRLCRSVQRSFLGSSHFTNAIARCICPCGSVTSVHIEYARRTRCLMRVHCPDALYTQPTPLPAQRRLTMIRTFVVAAIFSLGLAAAGYADVT